MTEVFMPRLLMLMLVITAIGSATGKLDTDSLTMALDIINFIEKMEQIYPMKNKEKKKIDSSSKFKK
jgi:hypothetical protein